MLTILGLILAGLFIIAIIKLIFKIWKNKITERFKNRNVKKVLSSELTAMEKNCTNRKSLSEIKELEKEGYTHIMAGMDAMGTTMSSRLWLGEKTLKASATERRIRQMRSLFAFVSAT